MIYHMSKFDYLNLDGNLLRLLVTVHEEGSITRAAQRLGVTQSAVSHLLDKLRAIVGDPLFVKSGRGIVATATAIQLSDRARILLDQLRDFGSQAPFDPAQLKTTLTIAANDLQRDLLLPLLFRRLRKTAPQLKMRVIVSGVPTAEMLRNEHCQLVLSPRPPDTVDIFQKRLFDDKYVVFYDAASREAPQTLEDYLAAEHVTVVYEPQRRLDIDTQLASEGIERDFIVQVSGFSGIPPFLRGSPYLATLPSLLGLHQLQGFAQTLLPILSPSMPMYAIWHQRYQNDPMHCWLRSELFAITKLLKLN